MKKRTLDHFETFCRRRPDLAHLRAELERASLLLAETGRAGGQILVCGNGGSAADSEHVAGELLKSFVLKRPVPEDFRQKLKTAYGEEGTWMADHLQRGVRCIPLTSFPAYGTAFLNDCSDRMLFAQLVQALGRKGDVLLCFSTSGNSANVLAAAKVARVLGIRVVALTGASGGKLGECADVLLNVPETETFRVQEGHLPLYHLLCLAVESELFEE